MQSEKLESVLNDLTRAKKMVETKIKTVEAIDPNSAALAALIKQRASASRAIITTEEQIEKAKKREALASVNLDQELLELEEGLKETFFAQYDINFVAEIQRYVLRIPSHWEDDMFVPSKTILIKRGDLVNYDVDLEAKSTNTKWRVFQTVIHKEHFYHSVASSFAPQPSTTLNLLNWSFLEPAVDCPPHWLFGCLMESLSGGRQENREHLEKVILAAYLHPEGNFLRPCQVFDDDGSIGKTLFATRVLTTLFGADLVVPNGNISQMDGFNSAIIGKAVVFLNEVSQAPEHSNVLKRILGSKEVKLEHKGVDAKYVDNTALYFISGNNKGTGTVALAGDGTDRRYSIHSPKSFLWKIVGAELKKSDPKMVINKANVEAWIRQTGQYILCDREEVGRWIASLIEKYEDVNDIAPLHGEDYRSQLGVQKSTADRVFEFIFTDPSFRQIKRKTLFEFYKKEESIKITMSRNRFYRLADGWLARNNFPIELKMAQQWGNSSADVYVRNDWLAPPTPLVSNDHEFFEEGEHGKIKWVMELPS